MSSIRFPSIRLLLIGLFLLPAMRALHAAEIHSNGFGGGLWSDPASWKEKKVPAAEDDAVISRGDVLVFGSNDDGRVSCKQIFIDPQGTLTLKSAGGDVVCVLAGQLESYGAVRIDGTRSGDRLEMRFIGPSPADRKLKLVKGASLLVAGKAQLPEGRHNVAIISRPAEVATVADPTASIEGVSATMMDLQRSDLVNVHVQATGIDNTGAKPNERINIVDNHLTGQSHLTLTSCDTPLVAGNLIEFSGVPSTPNSAMYINGCPLAEIRGNTVRGRFAYGIQGRSQVDSAVTDNTFEGCATGIYWYGTNGMLKQNTARKCDNAFTVTSMSGALEDNVADECKLAYNHAIATAQLTNFRVTNLPKDGGVASYTSGPLTLLNCNIAAADIKLTSKATKKAKGELPLVECLQFLIVAVKGKVPEGAVVEVRTAGAASLPAGAADLNVRNSPARLASNGLTPLPQTLEPLIVRSWSIDIDGEVLPPPKYEVRVLGPAAGPGKPGKILATATTMPADTWVRAEPNAPTPTLEIVVP